MKRILCFIGIELGSTFNTIGFGLFYIAAFYGLRLPNLFTYRLFTGVLLCLTAMFAHSRILATLAGTFVSYLLLLLFLEAKSLPPVGVLVVVGISLSIIGCTIAGKFETDKKQTQITE